MRLRCFFGGRGSGRVGVGREGRYLYLVFVVVVRFGIGF